MRQSILFSVLLLLTSLASAQTPAPKDVDIAAPDGIKLRATFFAASNVAASKASSRSLAPAHVQYRAEIVGARRARTEPVGNQHAHHR